MDSIENLPITPFLPAIVSEVLSHLRVIIKAQPGAGKTTQVPKALLSGMPGKILVLEPRRLAARLSAQRVAQELGENCGQTVGFQVRFDAKWSDNTRLLFVTEGVFLRLLQDDSNLSGISAVVLDEFHERHLHTDLTLALVSALQNSTRPDLALVVMSATLDTVSLEHYLPGARVFDVPGKTFPVAIEYHSTAKETNLEDRVTNAVTRMLDDPRCPGDILVFLTGIQEIRRCVDKLKASIPLSQASILALAADLSEAEQSQVFRVSERRKVILSTNVAETSVTIPGVTGVIDCGLAKIAGHATWSGLPTLDIKKISQASAIQRSGRAGRTASGVAYRLYDEADFLSRPAFSVPDILRLDLTEIFLTVQDIQRRRRQTVCHFETALPWLEPPLPAATEAARQLLFWLGALNDGDQLTNVGERLAEIPLHPRLAAIIIKGKEMGCPEAALAAACLIGEGMILKRGQPATVRSDCDVRFQIGLITKLIQGDEIKPVSLANTLDHSKVKQILNIYRQLSRRLRCGPWPGLAVEDESRLSSCLLAGFPDRVAKKRIIPVRNQRRESVLYNFCLGRGGILSDGSVIHNEDLILALDASETASRSADRGAVIYIASTLSVDNLRDAPSQFSKKILTTSWNEEAARADPVQRLMYGELLIDENRITAAEGSTFELEELLLEKLITAWPKPFDNDHDLVTYHAQVECLKRNQLGNDFPIFEGEMLELLQAEICSGKRSFREIKDHSLASYIEAQLSYEQQELLRRLAPLELVLKNGRRLKVTYELGKPPTLSGFIQDFFGLMTTPEITGTSMLTLELWAPNRRPQQVTSDLTSFWRLHYPKIRGELGRKYPRHYWPEEPATAKPFLYYNQWRTSTPNTTKK